MKSWKSLLSCISKFI